MSRVCIKLVNSLVLLLFACSAMGQNNIKYSPGFYLHLKEHRLFNEQAYYLKMLQANCTDSTCADTIRLSKALCFFLMQDTGACRSEIRRIHDPASFTSEKQQKIYTALLFSAKNLPELQKLKTLPGRNMLDNRAELCFKMLKKEPLKTERSDSLVLNEYPMKITVFKYTHYKKKSPALAGFLSALLPGLGKLYAGYKYQAFSAFTTNLFMGAQMTEAIFKSGLKSGHFAYTCALFSVYYLGNIAGSVWSAKKKRNDHFNEVDDEIVSYYNSLLLAGSN